MLRVSHIQMKEREKKNSEQNFSHSAQYQGALECTDSSRAGAALERSMCADGQMKDGTIPHQM